MAIARLSTGEVFANHSDINEALKPVQVGRFAFPEEMEQKVNALAAPLTREGADYIYSAFDPNAETMMKKAGFDFKIRQIGCYGPPKERGGECSFTLADDDQSEPLTLTETEEEASAYSVPHYLKVFDWYFIVSGTIMKGVQLEDGVQAMVYATPGEWLRFAPTVLNWPIMASGSPVIAVCYYDRGPNEEGGYDMEFKPDHTVMDTVKF